MIFSIETKHHKILKNLKIIYGIGHTRAIRFHKRLGLNLRFGPTLLTKSQRRQANFLLKRLTINQKLRAYLKSVYQLSSRIKSCRGLRNKYGLPCRGQQTRTNAKTKKKLHF